MRHHRLPLPGLLLTLMLALASAAQGLAYRYDRPVTDPALIAFIHLGGSLDDLCSGGASHRGIPCDFQLIGPAPIPEPARLPQPAGLTPHRAPFLTALNLPPLAPRDPAHGVRGPPVAVLASR